jgi:ABC-type multidrug transport system ATPase subunit
MKIDLVNVSKRYNREWIFRNLTFRFQANKHYAITGPNGSGKSTLLQIIGGSTTHNDGKIIYEQDDKHIAGENLFKQVAFAAPYLDLVEEMTLTEFFNFHERMKSWLPALDTQRIIHLLSLDAASHKQLRYFSSGMKQRVKLAQAIFSNVPAVLLDEPVTNLDDEGILLYNSLIKNYCKDRLVIVSSNDKNEYFFCEEIIDMRNFK